MRFLVTAFALLFSTASLASSINPEETNLPWRNNPDRNAVYKLSDHPNKVHVFEALKNSCGWCHRNAPQVEEMAQEYAEDERVEFIDLSLDSSEREIQRWLAQHQPSYPFVKDVNRNVWNALNQSSGVPQTFVVDCNGELVGSTLGYWGSNEKTKIRRLIEEAKEVTCVN